ncbi:MAG: energy transducer TonB [Bdellovibrionia bacterium]
MLLHGGLFAFAILGLQQNSNQSPLPLGVELAYVESPVAAASPAQATKSSEKVVVQKKETSLVAPQEQTEAAPTSVVSQSSSGIQGQGTQAGALTGREGVANGSEVSPAARYLFELRKLIERKKVYPQMARSMGQQGTVQVKFTIDRGGKVLSVELEKGAHPSLNEATLKLIKSIEGIKPFPPEIADNSMTLTLPVEYSLR